MSVFKKSDRSIQDSFSNVEKIQGPSASHIGKTLVIKGKIRASEEILIDGKVEGHLNVKNRIIIGKNGIIKADIESNELVIQGRVDGNVKASSKVEIFPDGILNGNIVSQRVVLAEGAVFKGNIDMSTREERKPQPPPPVVRKDTGEKKDESKK